MSTWYRMLFAAFSFSIATSAQAVLYQYEGVVETCESLCSLFTVTGEDFNVSFEADAGPGLVDVANITNVEISIATSSGGALAFCCGDGVSSDLLVDEFNNVIGGSVMVRASGASDQSLAFFDVPAGTWEMYVLIIGQPATLVAAGSGAFVSTVPLPGAAGLFALALGGLLARSAGRRVSAPILTAGLPTAFASHVYCCK